MNATQSKSLAELMQRAIHLSLQIAYETITPHNTYFDVRTDLQTTEQNESIIWGWADGLVHRQYQNISSGRCSLQTTIDFDVAKFEDSVKRDIEMMESLSKRLGPPRQLTCEEMTARGYKGYENKS